MKSYTQLAQEQRYQISALIKMEHTQTEIANLLGVHKTTISREIRRNSGLNRFINSAWKDVSKRHRRVLNLQPGLSLGAYSRRGIIPNQISIEHRPAIIDTYSRFGDWEMDTVIGRHHRQALSHWLNVNQN